MTARRGLAAITIVGRGKVGASLARAAVEAGLQVSLVGSRAPIRRRDADLFVLAVSDGAVHGVAEAVAASGAEATAMVHTAGLLAPDHLAALRSRGWAVGQAHPLASFAGSRQPLLAGTTVLIGGDPLAVRRARALARALELRPFVSDAVDRATWHAVAALVANGAAALAALGAERWLAAGVPERVASRALASLLVSVAANVAALGAGRALSGPVRRGDTGAVGRHLAALAPGWRTSAGNRGGPATAELAYAALALAQVPLARTLGEASPASLRTITRLAEAVVAGNTAPERAPRPRPGASRGGRGRAPRSGPPRETSGPSSKNSTIPRR